MYCWDFISLAIPTVYASQWVCLLPLIQWWWPCYILCLLHRGTYHTQYRTQNTIACRNLRLHARPNIQLDLSHTLVLILPTHVPKWYWFHIPGESVCDWWIHISETILEFSKYTPCYCLIIARCPLVIGWSGTVPLVIIWWSWWSTGCVRGLIEY